MFTILNVHIIILFLFELMFFFLFVSQQCCFFSIFDQINAALVSIKHLFQKPFQTQTFAYNYIDFFTYLKGIKMSLLGF